ncbi:hypothetical protein FB451DRAFT_1169620 [Mycena latifolia]|nr:hypothetical protein FB451DRAFT_1169620 [Mycena latifolia]
MYTLRWYFSSKNIRGAKAKDLAHLLAPVRPILHDHQIVRAHHLGPEPLLGVAFLAGVVHIFRAVPTRDVRLPGFREALSFKDLIPNRLVDEEAPSVDSPHAEPPCAESPRASPGAASVSSFDSEPWMRGDTPTHPLIDDEAVEASEGHDSDAAGLDSNSEAPCAKSLKCRHTSSPDSNSAPEVEGSGANPPPPNPSSAPSRAKSPSVPFSDVVVSHVPEGSEAPHQGKSSRQPPIKRTKVEYKRPARVEPRDVHDDKPFAQYGCPEDKKAKDFGLCQDAIHFVPSQYLRETGTYVQAQRPRAMHPGLGFSCERCGNAQREKYSHQLPSSMHSAISTNIANGLPLPLQTALAMDKELEHAATLLQGVVHLANEAGRQYTYAIHRVLHHALLTCANTSPNNAACRDPDFNTYYECLTRYADCLTVSLDKAPLSQMSSASTLTSSTSAWATGGNIQFTGQ